jgi:Na+/H+ antiporter NhaD/arsenite permease-like protein
MLIAITMFALHFTGLVPMAAAVFAVIADAVLNRRAAQVLVKRADWSIILLLFALFVWVQGFNNTHIVHFLWERFGLQKASYEAMGMRTLAAVCMFVLVGSNLVGTIPIVLIICDLLEPCAYQRGLVLYLAVLSTAGGNLALYGSISNMMTVQRSIQVLKYRPSFLTHFQYGFLTSLVLLPLGIMLIYGLLLIGVR